MVTIIKSTLALDLGLKTGWAYNLGKEIVSGVWELSETKYSGGGFRFVRFRKNLNVLHAAQPIGQVYYEAVRRHEGVDAAHAYGGFMSHLQAWCEEHEPVIPYEGIPVQTIKLFITGRGNAKKDDVIHAVEDRGYHPKDDNEADAIALNLYAQAE